MKKRFMVILLAGGLTLGLCGCGGGSSTSAMPAPPEETVELSVEDEAAVAESEVGAEEADVESYSADELVEMWSSGSLSMEDIEYKTATGEIDYEVYEEFLDTISNNEEFTIQSEETSEDEQPTNSIIDTSTLLTTHVTEYEDQDGYMVRETCQLSPIFTEDDMKTVLALWEALGNDAASFPDEDSLYDKNYLLRDARDSASCDKLEYIVGTYMIENLTDGFPITPDSPRVYSSRLAAKQVPAFDEEHDGTAASVFNDRYVIVAMYPDGAVYYDEEDAGNSGVMLGISEMESDTCGPYTFIIALPNGTTPNRPDGYRYDEIQLQFGCLASPYSDSDTFGLAYFE